MYTTLTIKDASSFGLFGDDYVFKIDLATKNLTLRELLRTRVQREVEDFNARRPEYFRGLVQPSEAERTLNGFKLRSGRALDWEKEFEKALQAFARYGFVVLVDDRQVDDLDEIIEIGPQTAVTFLKLAPLVGG